MRLRRVCARCQRVEDEGDPGADTTHTCCDTCFPRWMAEAGLDAGRATPPAKAA